MNKLDRIFSMLAIIAGLTQIVLCINYNTEDTRIKKTGLKATATVIRTSVTFNNPKSRTHNSFKDKSIWGIYQFKAANGKLYEVRAKSSGAHLGQKTTVYYNPANPERENYLDNDSGGFFIGIAIGSVITIIGAAFFIRSLK